MGGRAGEAVREREAGTVVYVLFLCHQLTSSWQTRIRVEDQARALTAFVTKLDALGLGGLSLGSLDKENETPRVTWEK